MTAIWVEITATRGSTPRDAGTAMKVTANGIEGTIGGGALEFAAINRARRLLASGKTAFNETLPLGPNLGQCCGGSVTLQYRAADTLDEPARSPLWIYGAGHVGRAIVNVMAPLPQFDITWVDTSADRFPDTQVTTFVAADPVLATKHAPDNADHLILTYSHEMDLALCHALLSRPFGSIGLIGSATKWARFRKRLATLGHAHEQISRIACPIGDPTLGKHPAEIALGVGAAMIARVQTNAKDRSA